MFTASLAGQPAAWLDAVTLSAVQMVLYPIIAWGGGSVGATSMPTANINAAATGTGGGSAASGPSQRSNVTLVGDYFGREAVIGLLHEAFKDGFTLSGA